ncbi:hypothetical protein CANCADRAFT_4094 [Tortispora caseinolytica NRRL Y-17796]|uniref:Mitochondrial glycine transporter n=1 Tax=Tortispora caseinolytica NRRL Y-17796 TaxID=767744 RepID=A0A1E4TCI1_9ASCO|nr:hypothetical protein CANCADRAFT_4094 [Tortispora caseinolytica NRRL Y-17796]
MPNPDRASVGCPSSGSVAKRPSAIAHMTAGFTSGLLSAVTLQPLDLLKTRLQQGNKSSIRSEIRKMSSPIALWRGTLPSAARTSIGAGFYFACLSAIRDRMLKAPIVNTSNEINADKSSSVLPKLSSHANLVAGAFARSVAGLLTMPITVVKVRFESSLFTYKSISDCIVHIYKENGISGFYKGYGVTTARDAPNAGLYIMFYEKLKTWIPAVMFGAQPLPETVTDSLLPPKTAAFVNYTAGALAAALATTLANPFDAIKTRIQLEPNKYHHFFQSAALMLKEDGARSFFDGLALRMGRKMLSSGIAWCIYEELVRRAT